MQPIKSISFSALFATRKYYEYCSSYGHMKFRRPTEKENWLKFHDSQCQFNIPFMLYVDFENILEPLDDQCREKLNRLNAEQKCETPYTEKFNTDIPFG